MILGLAPPGGPQSAALVGEMTRSQAADAVNPGDREQGPRQGAGTYESCPPCWSTPG